MMLSAQENNVHNSISAKNINSTGRYHRIQVPLPSEIDLDNYKEEKFKRLCDIALMWFHDFIYYSEGNKLIDILTERGNETLEMQSNI